MKTIDLETSIENIVKSMTPEQRAAWSALNEYEWNEAEILASAQEEPVRVLASLAEVMSARPDHG